jgi:hypothetical protein
MLLAATKPIATRFLLAATAQAELTTVQKAVGLFP